MDLAMNSMRVLVTAGGECIGRSIARAFVPERMRAGIPLRAGELDDLTALANEAGIDVLEAEFRHVV